jgi:ATP-dependent RNA helicase DDX3X
MIARSPLAGDSPTQMHGRAGGPPPAGYGQNPYASGQYGGGGGYGTPPTSGYGGGGYGTAPQPGHGGGPQQNYGQQPSGGQQPPGQGRGGRPGDPRGQQGRTGDRRVDWLDD